MVLKTIIVEDEPLSRIFLQNLLTEFCEGIEVLASVHAENEAVEAINQLQPDLVFLDIELQQGSGFGVLSRISAQPYIIFTTAFDHHAIKAIQFSGVDYLHKPIDIEGLQQAIEQMKYKRSCPGRQQGIQHLLETLAYDYKPAHLSVPSVNGIIYIPLSGIIRIEGNAVDCTFFLGSGERVIAKKNLKEYELLLADQGFFRVHLQHLVKLSEIVEVVGDSELKMKDGTLIPVSPRKVSELKNLLSF